MYRSFMLSLLALSFAFPAAGFAQKAKNEWAKGVPFHTDWDDAIREVKATGKLLFIYNGWRDAGI